MLFSSLKLHYRKLLILALAIAFISNISFSNNASAVVLPDIMNSAPTWASGGVGFFYGQTGKGNYCVDNSVSATGSVICGGFTGAYAWPKIADVPGTQGVVSDANDRFSEMVRAELYGGVTGSQQATNNRIGAAYIIFDMLGKTRADVVGDDPVVTAGTFFAEWKALVDEYFDLGLVVRFDYGTGHQFYNTYFQTANSKDVAWYYDDSGKRQHETILFLDSENPTDYTKAVYAIRLACGNPLGRGAPPVPKKAEVTVETEIMINNNGTWSTAGTTEVQRGDLVKWRHTITSTSTDGKKISGTYSLWDNKSGVTYSGNNTDSRGGATFSHNSGGVSWTKEFRDVSPGVVSVVTTGDYTIPDNASPGTTYCENESVTPTTGGKKTSSMKCARVSSSSPPGDSFCTTMPGYVAGLYEGRTVGLTEVANLSRGDGWHSGTTPDEYTTYAKPGDSIQFHHVLCPGAQAVRITQPPDHSRHDPQYYYTDSSYSEEVTQSHFPVDDNCTITATPSNYLFKNTDSYTNCSKKGDSAMREFYSPGSVTMGGSQVKGDVGKMYECVGTSFPNGINNGYQIPSFATKPSDCGALAASDVGKIINQKMAFSKTYATSKLYNEPWTDNYCAEWYKGSCVSMGSTTKYHSYYVMDKDEGSETTQAQVKIPFNYTTTTRVTTSQGILFPGENYSVNAYININTRNNSQVDPTGSYATITKDSVYEIVAFTVAPDKSQSDIAQANSMDNTYDKSAEACRYYSRNAITCASVFRSTDNVKLNKFGNLNGSQEHVYKGTDNINDDGGLLAVPDAEVGTKFCVAVAVFPSNSHDRDTGNDGVAMEPLGDFWNYSAPTCRTIAKKPSVQVWGSGVYTKGSISTSQSEKSLTYEALLRAGGNAIKSKSIDSGNRRVFGSWAEYEVIAMKNVSGFGSGAALGYELNNGGNSTKPGGYIDTAYDHSGEFMQTCKYGKETMSNTTCTNLGNANIEVNDTIVSRIISRYHNMYEVPAENVNKNCIVADAGHTDCPTSNKVIPIVKNDESSAVLGNYANFTQVKYIRVDGSAFIPDGASFCQNVSEQFSRTVVIDVAGTLTIGENIYNGSNYANEGHQTSRVISTGNAPTCYASSYDNIAQIPQTIIIAHNIHIDPSVENIDAWLIAGYNGGSGIIDTCYGYEPGDNLNADVCNKQLKVNGPVFAKTIRLNRTYGAGSEELADKQYRYSSSGAIMDSWSTLSPNPTSIDSAEIFNLRADAYLWAYAQAQRFSQAVTTYSRELAPRY